MLADIIHPIAAMKYSEERDGRGFYPRPSSAGPETCLRQMVYAGMGYERKTLPGRAVAVFDDGSWHAELVLDWLRKSTFHIHSEEMAVDLQGVLSWMPEGTWTCSACNKKVSHKTLHGHLDGLADDVLGGTRLLELKAFNRFRAEAIWKGDIPYNNLTQKAIYLRGIQQVSPDCKEGILLIKNKDTSAFLELRSEYDSSSDTLTVIERVNHLGERDKVGLVIPNITNDAIARFAEVYKHLEAKTLPSRQYDIDSWRCSYCPYPQCYDGYVQEHQALTADIALEQDAVDLVVYEREVARHESEINKEREELKKKIKAFLKERGVRSGRAGAYSIEWVVETQKKFNKDLLPPGAYQAAMEDAIVERLRIRKAKEEKNASIS